MTSTYEGLSLVLIEARRDGAVLVDFDSFRPSGSATVQHGWRCCEFQFVKPHTSSREACRLRWFRFAGLDGQLGWSETVHHPDQGCLRDTNTTIDSRYQ